MKRLASMIICASVLGSAYATGSPLSESAAKVAATMTEEEAVQAVRKELLSTGEPVGFCEHYILSTPVEATGEYELNSVQMSGSRVEFKYGRAVLVPEEEAIRRAILASYGLKPVRAAIGGYTVPFELKDTSVVTLGKNSDKCKGEGGKTVVQLRNLYPTLGFNHLRFQLAPENLDRFLGAIKKLSRHHLYIERE